MGNEVPVTQNTVDDKKSRSYYGVRPDFTDNDSQNKNVYSGGSDAINDLDLNDGKNRYVIMSPDQNSRDVEAMMKRKYPKSSFSRINNDEFKMVSSNGDEIAIVHSNMHGKHVILVERPTNRKKTTDQPAADTQVNEHFYPRFRTNSAAYHKANKYREDDEVMRKPAPILPAYEPPKKDHYLIVKSKTPLDTPVHEGKKIGDETYAVPIHKDDHDKLNGLSPYHRSHDESEIISNEDFRNRELPKYRSEVMKKILPGIDAEFKGARKIPTPENNDHYALLHVPKGAEEDVKKLNGVKVSPKGRYYVMIPKSVHEINTTDKNIIVGDMTGFHDVNNVNNPNRYKWAPNYHMTHAISVEKTLSPEDIKQMKTNK